MATSPLLATATCIAKTIPLIASMEKATSRMIVILFSVFLSIVLSVPVSISSHLLNRVLELGEEDYLEIS